MSSDFVMQAIEEIGRYSSKQHKESSLILNMGNESFVRAIKLGLDPFITFGIRPARVAGVGTKQFDDDDGAVWKMLDDLAARRLTGNEARDTVAATMKSLTPESSELLWRIIQKDFRAGFAENTVNAVAKGAFQTFPYMRCSLPKNVKLDEWDWGRGVISQEKADGMFVNVDHDEFGVVNLRTRQGSPLPIESFEEMVGEIRGRLLPGTQTHGEILVKRDGEILAREVGNGVLNSVLKGGAFEPNERPILKVWDQIPLGCVVPKGEHKVEYRVRLAGIIQQLKTPGKVISLIDTRVVRSLKEAYEHYKFYLKQGREGTVIKRQDGFWRDTGSSGSKDQVKLKLEAPCELKIVGFRPGEPGKKTEATFGALICRSECGKLEVGVSGMTDAKRLEIHSDRDGWIGRIVTVVSNSIMEPSESNELHSLFLPRFIEERLDKTEADTLERIREQFDNAVEAV